MGEIIKFDPEKIKKQKVKEKKRKLKEQKELKKYYESFEDHKYKSALPIIITVIVGFVLVFLAVITLDPIAKKNQNEVKNTESTSYKDGLGLSKMSQNINAITEKLNSLDFDNKEESLLLLAEAREILNDTDFHASYKPAIDSIDESINLLTSYFETEDPEEKKLIVDKIDKLENYVDIIEQCFKENGVTHWKEDEKLEFRVHIK